MNNKLIDWLSKIDSEKKRGTDVLASKKNHDIVSKLFDSESSTNLNILIKVAKIEPKLVDLQRLESACIAHAPLLLDDIRTIDGCDRLRIESNILKQLRPLECLTKLKVWYKDNIPGNLQAIASWKIYNQCYKELTSGQQQDKYLDEYTAKTLEEALNLIPKVITNKSAVFNIARSAAYVLRTGDASSLSQHHLSDNFSDLVMSSIWSFTESQSNKLDQKVWFAHSAGITFINPKFVSNNLIWLQMHNSAVYDELSRLETAESKDISAYLKRNREASGLTEPILNKKHADNNPGSIESIMSI